MRERDGRFTFQRVALLLLGAILLSWLLRELPAAGRALLWVWRAIFPFVLGCIFAFVLNLPMRLIERVVFRGRGGRLRRPVSLLLSMVLVLLIALLVINMVVPQIIGALVQLLTRLPGYLDQAADALEPYLSRYAPSIQMWLDEYDDLLTGMLSEIATYLQTFGDEIFSSTVSLATSIVGRVASVLISFVFTCHLLLGKERLLAQADGVLMAYLPQKAYQKVRDIAVLTHRTYAGFVGGQCVEALIEGLMFFVVLSIGRFSHAVLISVIMAFMALVPVVGAWIGSIFGALLLLISMGPLRMLAFIAITLVIQQVESNLIYPQVVGQSIGLPAIWTLVAVMAGSSVGGVFGILLCIPLFSVLYTLARRHTVARLKARSLPNPVSALVAREGEKKPRRRWWKAG